MFSLFGLSVICSVAYFFLMPVAAGSPFHYELSFRMSFQHHDDGGYGLCFSR